MGLKEVGAVVGHSLRTEEPEVQREGEGSGSQREDEETRGSRQKEGRVRSRPVFDL